MVELHKITIGPPVGVDLLWALLHPGLWKAEFVGLANSVQHAGVICGLVGWVNVVWVLSLLSFLQLVWDVWEMVGPCDMWILGHVRADLCIEVSQQNSEG